MPSCDSCGVEFKSDKDIYGDIIVYIIYGILSLGLYLVLRPLWDLFSKKLCTSCTPWVPTYTGSDK